MTGNKPKDILDGLIGYALLSTRRKGKPGEIVEMLSKENREILSQLKSEDIKNYRIK